MVAIFILSNLKFSFCKLIYPELGIVIEPYVASIVVRALLFKTQQPLVRINLEKLVILTYNIVTPLMRERNCNNVYKQRRIRKDVRNN